MTVLWRTIRLHCGRTLRGWSRTTAVVANGFVMPIGMLLIVLLIFGRSIEMVSSVDPIARLTPLMVCSGVMFAGVASSVALVVERESGLLERFATLPNPSSAPLLGRVVAEVVRGVASATLVLIVATAFGFRSGPVGYLVIVALAAAFAFALGAIMAWIGLTAKSPDSVMALTPLLMILMFFNSGFVPLDAFPDPVQPFVLVNPLSVVSEAMTGYGASDGSVGDLAAALGWCLALSVLGSWLLAGALRRRG